MEDWSAVPERSRDSILPFMVMEAGRKVCRVEVDYDGLTADYVWLTRMEPTITEWPGVLG